jgi:hypothetical protein
MFKPVEMCFLSSSAMIIRQSNSRAIERQQALGLHDTFTSIMRHRCILGNRLSMTQLLEKLRLHPQLRRK